MLEVINLHKHYYSGVGLFWGYGERVHAVNGVSFVMEEGETLGLIGESGCGKSTLARLIALLDFPTAGSIFFQGKEVAPSRKHWRTVRSHIQIVFQDGYSSLNPFLTIGESIAEPVSNFRGLKGIACRREVERWLEAVRLDPALADCYPHQLSGGQRQRVGVARALAAFPRLVVMDEPLSGLDVFTQGEILELLKKLREKWHLAYLFISHDLRAVRLLCDRVAVMYKGRIVEMLPISCLDKARHPYTRLLFSSIPASHPAERKDYLARDNGSNGNITREVYSSRGCYFAPRCSLAAPVCSRDYPPVVEMAEGWQMACWEAMGNGRC